MNAAEMEAIRGRVSHDTEGERKDHVWADRAALLSEVDRLRSILDEVKGELCRESLHVSTRAIRARAKLFDAGEVS